VSLWWTISSKFYLKTSEFVLPCCIWWYR